MLIVGLMCLLQGSGLYARPLVFAEGTDSSGDRFLARIQLHSAIELDEILRRADTLFQRQESVNEQPVVFVLHGAEARVFLQRNYQKHKSMVDRAARLSAFDLVDIRVCERWMGSEGIDSDQLVPFVTTVPYGPAEITRLREQEHYLDF